MQLNIGETIFVSSCSKQYGGIAKEPLTNLLIGFWNKGLGYLCDGFHMAENWGLFFFPLLKGFFSDYAVGYSLGRLMAFG